ncbi:uncharacterized protein LOC106171122 [Lingula anatina]|uniref:Uncharacterized protein LOC106171122 n=1 Tax=Lingula anatina TaxID=7574 RepID=A0A1S3IQE1_LINAN|nr:uncharacterized protein LOC106171122 [Lingula anatina]|eukprot:XP_013406734.1 uncharacterized protein LOC106171122 [Lingula anatina]
MKMDLLQYHFIAAITIITSNGAVLPVTERKHKVTLGFKSLQKSKPESMYGLPKIVVPELEKTLATKSQSNMSSIKEDTILQGEFPGQFFTPKEIRAMNNVLNKANLIQSNRKKRTLDSDICCRTNLWFGSAPESMKDWKGEGPYTFLKGAQTFQAYARGDCGAENPQPPCPEGGTCRQKQRLHLLWVESKTEPGKAELKYFYINNHCAYESLTYTASIGQKPDIRLPVAQALTSGDSAGLDTLRTLYPSYPGLP